MKKYALLLLLSVSAPMSQSHAATPPRHASAPAKKRVAPYTGKPKQRGLVRAFRVGFNEEFALNVGGGITPALRKKFAYLMRAGDSSTHAADARLMQLIAHVSDHFGGKKLEVVSGYRPKTPTQFTAHSRHNVGHAMDFRIIGVPNTVLRDFCRSLKNTGCGYYPNSSFVHMDTRESSAYWIDYSGPGERPRYHPPDAKEGTTSGEEDEGAGEVDMPAEHAVSEPAPRPGPNPASQPGNTPPAHGVKPPIEQASHQSEPKAEPLPKPGDAASKP